VSVYLGYDVLELNYDRVGAIDERVERKASRLDNKTGKRFIDAESPAANPVRPFSWSAVGKVEKAALRAFLDARVGRAVPFWLPSFQWDLTLKEDLNSGVTIATVVWCRYREQMFGTTGGRRHLALWPYGIGTPMQFYKIADADDPGNGVTESLTLSPGATQTYLKDTTVLSFLKLCRLEDDLVSVRYLGGDVAVATIQVRELPLEAPV